MDGTDLCMEFVAQVHGFFGYNLGDVGDVEERYLCCAEIVNIQSGSQLSTTV